MTTERELLWNHAIDNEDYAAANAVAECPAVVSLSLFAIRETSDTHVLLELPHKLDARTLHAEIQTNAPKPDHRFRHWWKVRGVVSSGVAPVEEGTSQYEPHTFRLEHAPTADQAELIVAMHGILAAAHETRARMEASLTQSRIWERKTI